MSDLISECCDAKAERRLIELDKFPDPMCEDEYWVRVFCTKCDKPCDSYSVA